MRSRDNGYGAPSAFWSAARCPCIAMSSTEASEEDQVGHALLQHNTGVLITYRRALDLLQNVPAGVLAMVILAAREPAADVRVALEWLRRRRHDCPVTVVADSGGGAEEIVARVGGAIFMTRPVGAAQWSALVAGAIARLRQKV